MTNLKEPHGAQVTFRLSPELDRQMRTTSEYFRRSLTEEWRAAGVLYQRAIRMWAATRSARAEEAPTNVRKGKAELVAELCGGLILEPKSLEDLRSALATLEPKEW